MAATEDLADLTRQVGGDKVKVESIARGYQDPHFVEAKPSFILKLAQGRPARRRRAASSRSAGCRRSSSRAATRRSSRAPRATSTPRSPRRSSRSRPARSRARWATSTRWATRTTGSTPATAAASRRRSPTSCRRWPRPTRPTSRRATPTSTSASPRPRSAGTRMMAPYKGLKIVTYHRSWPNFADRFGLDVIGYVEPRPGIPPSPSHTIDLIARDEAAEREDPARRALLRPQDARTSIGARDRAPRCVVMPPSVGGEKEITDYIKLFDYDLNLLVAAIKETGSEVDGPRRPPSSSPRPFVASLILAGIHAYLGVHVVERGVIFVDLSLAQIAALGSTIAHPAPLHRAGPARAVGLLDAASPSPSSGPRSSRRQGPPRPHPPGGDHRDRLRRRLRRHHPRDEQGHLGERAPQGHAGRQHPGRLVAGGRQDGGPLRGHRRLPLPLPPAVPGHLDGPREGRARRARP